MFTRAFVLTDSGINWKSLRITILDLLTEMDEFYVKEINGQN